LTSSGLPSNVHCDFFFPFHLMCRYLDSNVVGRHIAHSRNLPLTVTGTSASDTKTATTAVRFGADKDVGAVGVAGSAFCPYGNNIFTNLRCWPFDLQQRPTAWHFAYQPLSGDGSIVARIVTMSGMRSGTSGRAGVMIRESLNANSSHSLLRLLNMGQSNGRAHWHKPQKKPTTGSSTTFSNSGAISLPYWVKMVRSGTSFSAFIRQMAPPGPKSGRLRPSSWATTCTAGLAVSSNDNNNNSLRYPATIDNVTITASQWLPPSSPWSELDLGAVGVPETPATPKASTAFLPQDRR